MSSIETRYVFNPISVGKGDNCYIYLKLLLLHNSSKNTWLSVVFLTLFSVILNVVKVCLLCLIYKDNQSDVL